MMKRFAWILMLVVTPALRAQVPEDSGTAVPGNQGEAQLLRREIRKKWTEHVRTTLALSNEQAGKLDSTEQRFEGQRQPIRARQRQTRQALNAELASGAPNQDRVRELMSQQQQNQQALQQVNRDEDREMQGYLTPVQRARYQEERRKFQERVAELVRHRREQRRQMAAPAPRSRPAPRRRPKP